MSAGRRILFFAEAVTLAHVSRPFILAQALDPGRFDIHFACADGYSFVFQNPRLTHWTIESISGDKFRRCLSSGGRAYDMATLRSYVDDDMRVLDAVEPDLVVGDFRLSLPVSTRLKKVPYASLVNAHWSPYADRQFPLPDVPVERMLGVRGASLLFQLLRPAIFAYHARPMNQLCREYGLSPLGGLTDVYSYGDYTLYPDVPGLVSTRRLPSSHLYLGPILWSPSMPLPSWWDDIVADRPCIYVTLGSSGDVHLLPMVVDAIAGLAVTVVVATAGRAELRDMPGNVFVADYLPGRKIVERVDVVVCNGGSATAYQALAEGVPVIGLASNMDQYLTMSAISGAGAGILLRAGRATPASVAGAVELILNGDSYRRWAERIELDFRRFDAPAIFSNLVDKVLSEREP